MKISTNELRLLLRWYEWLGQTATDEDALLAMRLEDALWRRVDGINHPANEESDRRVC